MQPGALQRIERVALLLAGLATAISLVTWNPRWVLGVAAGGLLGVVNFYALRRIVGSLFQDAGGSRKQAVMAVLLTLKFGLLAASLFLAIRFLPMEPVGLLSGISVVVLAIFVESIRTMMCSAEPNLKSE